jgi:hypothetical protein
MRRQPRTPAPAHHETDLAVSLLPLSDYMSITGARAALSDLLWLGGGILQGLADALEAGGEPEQPGYPVSGPENNSPAAGRWR